MLIHQDKYVLTGGSSVTRGYWTAIDHPEQNSRGYWTKVQRDISKLFADYLLATGQVNGSYGYFSYKDLLIIQSRIDTHDPPQEHIFSTSLLKLLADFPDKSFLIKTPFDQATSISIRRRIIDWLGNLKDKTIAHHRDHSGEIVPITSPISLDPKRLQFIK